MDRYADWLMHLNTYKMYLTTSWNSRKKFCREHCPIMFFFLYSRPSYLKLICHVIFVTKMFLGAIVIRKLKSINYRKKREHGFINSPWAFFAISTVMLISSWRIFEVFQFPCLRDEFRLLVSQKSFNYR